MILSYRLKAVALCATAFMCLLKHGHAQQGRNLVPDSSFEAQRGPMYGACSIFTADSFSKYMSHWINPTNGTPDLYSYNYRREGLLRPPVFDSSKLNHCFSQPYCNYGGQFRRYYIFPKTGKSFLGLLYGKNTVSGINYIYHREFVQTRLAKPLEKNHKYEIGLSYICFPYSYENAPFLDMLLTTGQVGNTYTSDCYLHPDCTGLKEVYTPQARFQNLKAFTFDTGTWDTRKVVFRSKTEAGWLTVGRFKDTQSFYNSMPCNATGSYFYIDDIFVREIPGIVSPDTVCKGTDMALTTTLGMPYFWSSDKEGNHVLCRDSIYRFTAMQTLTLFAFGKQGRDSIHITVNSIPSPHWPDTIHLCEGDYKTIVAGTSQYDYRWQDNSADTSKPAVSTAYYGVLKSDKFGCKQSFTTFVYTEPLPVFALPADTFVCFSATGAVDIVEKNAGYHCSWEPLTGSACSMQITEPGSLMLTITSDYGCKASKKITVRDACEPLIYVPDAFGPHARDVKNRVWQPVVSYTSSYRATVYNRWGQVIWQSADAQSGWDGTYLGQPCEAGLYMCVIEAVGVHPYDDKTKRLSQTIQLVY